MRTITGYKTEILGLPRGADRLISELIHERLGLFFGNGKGDLLTDKLAPLVIQRGFASFLDYYYLLKYDEQASGEWLSVMNTLSVPETYFWREIDQVHALVNIITPRWFEEHPLKPLRIWSAACASGEEPLTIAMALDEAGWFDRGPIEIYASDASPQAIEKARRGVYRERAFRSLSHERREKYFTKNDSGSTWTINRDLHSRIKWSVVNLMNNEEVASLASAHAIFCRNVFIYFSDQTVTKAVRSFARYLRPPGYLFIGTSESLLRLTTEFDLQEMGNAFVYVKQ